jgi:hypothetical protein
MILYIIERLVKRKWHPLSFIQTSESGDIGVALRIYPAIGQSKDRTLKVLSIAEAHFPDSKFRMKEYRRAK